MINTAKAINIAADESLFNIVGFNGFMGSADATHLIMLKCCSWTTHYHKGFLN